MKISRHGLELIREFEGFSSRPYRDSVGVVTIGYGTTHYPGGRKVLITDKPIGPDEAEDILEYEVNSNYAKYVDHYVRRDTTQNEFDALVSFAYNLGVGALKSSTLLKSHNLKHKAKATAEFSKWIHAGGRTLQGLVNRRHREAEVYNV